MNVIDYINILEQLGFTPSYVRKNLDLLNDSEIFTEFDLHGDSDIIYSPIDIYELKNGSDKISIVVYKDKVISFRVYEWYFGWKSNIGSNVTYVSVDEFNKRYCDIIRGYKLKLLNE